MLEWEYYTDINTFKLFCHLLLNANYKDVRYKGILIPRGSLKIVESDIGEECGLTYQEVRTAIKKLLFSGEITKNSTNKFVVITITNYSDYQELNVNANEQSTNEQRTNNELLTNEQRTINELSTNAYIDKKVKKEKKEKNVRSVRKSDKSDQLSDTKKSELIFEYGYTAVNTAIDRWNKWKQSNKINNVDDYKGIVKILSNDFKKLTHPVLDETETSFNVSDIENLSMRRYAE